MLFQQPCSHCGTEFTSEKSALWCSMKCRARAKRRERTNELHRLRARVAELEALATAG